MTDSQKLDLILTRLACIEARLTLLENKIGSATYSPNYSGYYLYNKPLCSCPQGTVCGNVACPYAKRVTSSLSYNIG